MRGKSSRFLSVVRPLTPPQTYGGGGLLTPRNSHVIQFFSPGLGWIIPAVFKLNSIRNVKPLFWFVL